jgi:hypothetical protein
LAPHPLLCRGMRPISDYFGHGSQIEFIIQTYDPTIEDAYRKALMVDNQMSFIEVIDTAGQGRQIISNTD